MSTGGARILKLESKLRIEQAAYELIDEFGYDGISMLKIAKRAKASNETLYKWYGDKKGLFSALVEANTTHISQLIEDAIETNKSERATIEQLGCLLLEILLGDRAIALNKSAVADPSGDLGQALAKAGREAVFPKICQIFNNHLDSQTGNKIDPTQITEIYLRLLIGDLQIRRATGAIRAFSAEEAIARSKEALDLALKIIE